MQVEAGRADARHEWQRRPQVVQAQGAGHAGIQAVTAETTATGTEVEPRETAVATLEQAVGAAVYAGIATRAMRDEVRLSQAQGGLGGGAESVLALRNARRLLSMGHRALRRHDDGGPGFPSTRSSGPLGSAHDRPDGPYPVDGSGSNDVVFSLSVRLSHGTDGTLARYPAPQSQAQA